MNAIEFKTALATLGMSAKELAKRAGVDLRTVQRWTSTAEKWNVPDNIVAEYVQPELDRQSDLCEISLQVVEENADEHGEPSVVYLPWYTSDEELQEAHKDDPRTVAMANADSMRVWHVLQSLGYAAEFVPPAELPKGEQID